MKKQWKNIVWILIAALLCTQMPAYVYAQGEQIYNMSSSEGSSMEQSGIMSVSSGDAIQTGLGEDIVVKGETSFGTMLANELSSEMLEQTENNGFNVFSVEIQDEVAIVSLESVQDAYLVIGIYDEAGNELLASGSVEVYAGEETVYVEFEAGNVPEFFYIKGYLIEPVTYRPLCTVYESPMYTREMQEFLAKTTEDFDADRVLNLDEDTTNNFAVYGEETILLSRENGNDVVSINESTNTYVIENADTVVTALEPGDVFAYPYSDNDVLIVKVAGIEIDGTTVTIVGTDASMEEVFDYIKIDEEMGSGEAIVDASSCSDGVTYEGMVDYVDEDTPQTFGFEAGGSLEKAFKMKMDKELGSVDGISVKVSGGLDLKLQFSAKVYLTLERQYVELKLDYSAKVAATITGQVITEIPLITVGFMFTGIIVELTPSVVVEAKATISVEGTLSGTVGFRAEVGVGITNLTTYPQFKSTLKVEGSLFVGLSLCPRIKILSEKIASASLTAKVGVEIKASFKDPLATQEENKVHTCDVCVAGEVNGKFNISASLEFLNSIKFTITPVDWKVKIFDFYYSLDEDDFDLTTCPYYLYKGTVIVKDEDWKTIQNLRVRINNDYLTTDEKGEVEFWAPAGTYTISVTEEGYAYSVKELTLKNGGEALVVVLEKKIGEEEGDGNNNQEGNRWNEIKQVTLGEYYSAAITRDGELYLWGNNEYGQLGYGTNDNSNIPIKIMSGVKAVSLGYNHSAAITEEGDLFLWGDNWYGQLGDGRVCVNSNVPIKIMSRVKAVSVGGSHSAAISEEGDLYLWGNNNYGQLGNGTYGNISMPQKIMSGVKEVSVGRRHSAAITEEGDLYLWGDNEYGQLGDGTDEGSCIPKKIMRGVKKVSLGDHCGAAITEEGDLYLWGLNEWGQLGNGMKENSNIPLKIMSGIKEVSVEVYHNAAVTEEGDLYLWGCNWYGQLGDGTSEDSYVPRKLMSGIKMVGVGYGHSTAITEEGDLYMWGLSVHGQLGNGMTASSSVPIKVNIPPITESTTEFTLFSARAVNEIASELEVENQWSGTGFTNLTPNETYNYYIMQDKQADEPFAVDNLVYIGQAIADDNGVMEVTFSEQVVSNDADIFAVPMHRIDISEATASAEDLMYSGEKQYAKVNAISQGKVLVEGVDYNVQGDYGVTEPGEYFLTIVGIGLYEGTISTSYQVVKENTAYVIQGSVTSFGDESGEVTIQLLDENRVEVAKTSTFANNSEFTIASGSERNYVLRVSKLNHVTREYAISISESDIQQDIEIYLLGDVDGNGRINARDKKTIYNHIAGESELTGYEFRVGDVNGDGKINARDKKMIYNHIAGESLLW